MFDKARALRCHRTKPSLRLLVTEAKQMIGEWCVHLQLFKCSQRS